MVSVRSAVQPDSLPAPPSATPARRQLSQEAITALFRLKRLNVGEARRRLEDPSCSNELLYGGGTLLHALCEQRDAAAICVLLPAALAAGADVNKPDAQGCTPLHYAANNVDAAAAEAGLQLLLAAGADPAARAVAGLTPLHTAARNACPEAAATAVRLLAAAGAPLEAELEDSAGRRRPLHMAVAANDSAAGMEAAVQALAAAGADVGAAASCGSQPLHIAAARCRAGKAAAGTISALLAVGAAPNARDDKGLSALHHAVGAPAADIAGGFAAAQAAVEILLAGGADPDQPTATPLPATPTAATGKGLSTSNIKSGWRPIHAAALLPDAQAAVCLIAALVAAGASVEGPDGSGRTALQLAAAAAARSSEPEGGPAAAAVCALMEAGASVGPVLKKL